MKEALTSAFSEELKHRFLDKFWGPFFVSLALLKWKFFVVLLSSESTPEKIMLGTRYLSDESIVHLCYALAIATGRILWPFFSRYIQRMHEWIDRQNRQHKAMKDREGSIDVKYLQAAMSFISHQKGVAANALDDAKRLLNGPNTNLAGNMGAVEVYQVILKQIRDYSFEQFLKNNNSNLKSESVEHLGRMMQQKGDRKAMREFAQESLAAADKNLPNSSTV